MSAGSWRWKRKTTEQTPGSIEKWHERITTFMPFLAFAPYCRVWGRHSPTRFREGQNEQKCEIWHHGRILLCLPRTSPPSGVLLSSLLPSPPGKRKMPNFLGHDAKYFFSPLLRYGHPQLPNGREKSRRIYKKSLRLTARRYSVFVPIVKGERQRFRLLLPLIARQRGQARLSTAAHFSAVHLDRWRGANGGAILKIICWTASFCWAYKNTTHN